MTDGEGNKTTHEYDGHDRPVKTRFPSTTKGSGTSSTTDYEELTYDAGSNVTARRLRDGTGIALSYDALNRLIAKDLPGSEPDVAYTYDALSRMTGASQTGNALTFGYDALSRLTSAGGPQGTTTSAYDAAGRRTRITHADGFYVDQDYLVTGETWKLRENGATSGVGVLATYAYDDLGRRTSLTRGNGTVKSYGYDAVSRLSSLGEDLAGSTGDLTQSFTYNPASQIATVTRSNDSYAWSDHYNLTRNYGANGLNQYISSGSVTPTYDAKGNLTSAGLATYAYSSENLLTSASGGIALTYDPMLRLYQTSGGTPGTTRFAYDGNDLIAEYNSSNAMLRRYVHGPADDEPLVWYEGSGTSDRRFLHADERGSVIATSNSSGTTLTTNAYDEYGVPKSTNTGRFQYTGQTWLAELGMYYYKARIYSPTLGRFLQTDPIGYGDGMNLYAYVGGDPVNFTDPTGLCGQDEVEVARSRTGRPEGDVVALYLLFCMQVFEDTIGGPEGPVTNNGPGGADSCAAGDPTCEVTVTGKRPIRQLRPCEADFAGQQFTLGMSWDLRNVEFRYGRDGNTNDFSHMALDTENAGAVTQGHVIYVKPSAWANITNPNNSAFWEEVFHTTQFSKYQDLFYMRYGAASAAAAARGEDMYWGNALEVEAKAWAVVLVVKFRKTRPCKN